MSQLSLFAPPTRRGGMPRSVEAKLERAQTGDVRQAYLAVARALPGDWLAHGAFREVRERYDLTCCWARPLDYLVRAGLLEQRNVYAGSETPGPDYKGFHNEWRAIAE